jgi:hypothetical protein
MPDDKCDRCGRFVWPQNGGQCRRAGCRAEVDREIDSLLSSILVERLVGQRMREITSDGKVDLAKGGEWPIYEGDGK